MPTVDWTKELSEQLDWHWGTFVRPHLHTLTDDEYLWEPAPGCWSLRARDSSTAAITVGAGDVVIEFAHPAPTPPPLTTIAWRMGHIAVGCLGMRAASHFGAELPDYAGTDWSLTAEGGLAMLDTAYAAWAEGVRGLDDAGLAAPCGPAEGPFAEYPMAALVLHINREVLHHGAELLLLRDLHARRHQLGV